MGAERTSPGSSAAPAVKRSSISASTPARCVPGKRTETSRKDPRAGSSATGSSSMRASPAVGKGARVRTLPGPQRTERGRPGVQQGCSVPDSCGVRDAACPVRTGCTVAQVEFERGVVLCQAGRRDLQPERSRHVELDGHKRRDPGARRQHLRATPGHDAQSRRPVTAPGHGAARAAGRGGGPCSRRPRPTRRKRAPRNRPARPAAKGTRPRARRRPRTW